MGSEYDIGIKIGLSGEKEYRDGLKAINDDQKVLSSETAKTTAAFDKNDKSVEALTARNGQLEKSLELQRQRLEACRKGLENASAAWGEADKRTVQWQKDLNYAEAQVIKTEKAIRENTAALAKLNREAESKSLKNFADGAKAAGESLDKMGNKLTMGLTVPLVAAGAASANFASDTVESIGKVEVAFGYAAEGVKNWSDSTLTSMGLAKGTALDMAALYGDMATSMGFAQATAADMSKTLVGLGADLASYKNISIDVANTALKAIFTGETESLKGLGVVMTQANLQAYAMAQGFKTAYKDMDQTQQVAVRYKYVLAQTANAQGDFARTSDNTANQLRILQESMKEAAALAGDQLLPIITPIVGRVGELAQSFGNLDEGTRKAVVQAGLFLAALGPMLKATSGVTAAISAGAAAHAALTAAKTADTVVTVGQTQVTISATAAQTGLNAAMNANPIGAVATAIGVLVAALGSFIAVTALTSEKTENYNANLRETVSSTDRAVQSIEADTTAKLANLEAVKRLLPQIDALNSKSDRTSAEQSKLNALVETANGLYPNLVGEVDSLTGSYDLNTTSIANNIEAIKKQLKAQAGYDMAAKQYESAAKLRAELAAMENDFREIEAQRREAANNALILGDNGTWWRQKERELDAQAEKLKKTAAEIAKQIQGYDKAAEDIIDTTARASSATGGLGQSAGSAADAISKEGAAASSTSKTLSTLISDLDTAAQSYTSVAEAQSVGIGTSVKLQQEYANLVTENSALLSQYPELYAKLDANNTVQQNSAAIAQSVWGIKRQLLIEELKAQADNINTQIQNLESYKNAAITAYAAIAAAAAMSFQDGGISEQRAEQLGQRKIKQALAGDSSYQDLVNQANNIKAQIESLKSVSIKDYAAGTTTAKKKSSKKEETEEDKQVKAYKAAMDELDYLRGVDEISEADYYTRMAALRDQYLTKDSDAWRDATVKLHQYREKAQKEAADAEAKAKQEAYETELADLKYFRDLSLISEQRYYADLAKLRDAHLEEDSEEWRRVTVEIHQWQQKKREESLKAEKEAYETAQKQRANLVKQYTEQRIAAIKAEQKAEEERLNALIEGIDEEIAARKRLRQVESDDDAIAKAQKTLDAAKAQLSFARDETSRRELEKEVLRAQQALDSALQGKADNDFYYTKNQEKDALRDQLDAARDKYQGQIDNAPAWAEQRAAAEEAAAERREREEAAAAQRSEQERAAMESLQKMAAGALAAAGSVVNQVTNAISKVTNNNKVSITTGGSMLTSGQLARAAEKAIDKLAK